VTGKGIWDAKVSVFSSFLIVADPANIFGGVLCQSGGAFQSVVINRCSSEGISALLDVDFDEVVYGAVRRSRGCVRNVIRETRNKKYFSFCFCPDVFTIRCFLDYG
jgi:hypothetical protein